MRGRRLAFRASIMGMALVLGASASLADTVELNDGTVHKGKVVADSPEVVGFKTEAGKLLMIKKTDIKELKKEEATPEEPKGKEGPQPAPEKKPEKPAKITMDVLKARKVSFDFVETPLKDVLEHLTKVSAIPISLDEKLPDEARTVTLRVQEMDLKGALNWICKLVGLQCVVKPDGVIVTSRERAILFEEKVRRAYNVEKLVKAETHDGRGNKLPSDVAKTGLDAFLDRFKMSVEPGSWGKEYGTSVTLNGDTLIVIHTETAQTRIKEYISNSNDALERYKKTGR